MSKLLMQPHVAKSNYQEALRKTPWKKGGKKNVTNRRKIYIHIGIGFLWGIWCTGGSWDMVDELPAARSLLTRKSPSRIP